MRRVGGSETRRARLGSTVYGVSSNRYSRPSHVAEQGKHQELPEDSGKALFDIVVAHTLDRWSRNLREMLESMRALDQKGEGLVSITENIDNSTPAGRWRPRWLGSVAEFFSEALSTHARKGISERAHQGRHLVRDRWPDSSKALPQGNGKRIQGRVVTHLVLEPCEEI